MSRRIFLGRVFRGQEEIQKGKADLQEDVAVLLREIVSVYEIIEDSVYKLLVRELKELKRSLKEEETHANSLLALYQR